MYDNYENNESGFLIFANANRDGLITEAITGYNIIPDKSYKYFFYRDQPVDIERCKIIDGKLIEN